MFRFITNMILIIFLVFITTSLFAEIRLQGTVNADMYTYLKQEMYIEDAILAQDKPIEIYISSPGGQVFEGFKIMNRIEAYKASGRDVHIIVEGLCASMCMSILQTATKRSMYPFAILMQHNTSGGSKGMLRTLDLLLNTHESKRSGIPLQVWSFLVKATVYLTPAQALRIGLIDNISLPKL